MKQDQLLSMLQNLNPNVKALDEEIDSKVYKQLKGISVGEITDFIFDSQELDFRNIVK